MSQSSISSSAGGMLEEIIRFIGRSSGLKVNEHILYVEIIQVADGRRLIINANDLEAVLDRQDQDGRPFLQLNLKGDIKILLTDHLIGFKPRPTPGLDLKKLPRVVTTPDLISILDALDEAMGGSDTDKLEGEMLKKAYFSVVTGAETIGFKMDSEKNWIIRLIASHGIIAS